MKKKNKKKIENHTKLTSTLPVNVWADIMTPAQSFTDVIHPTSAATFSSFSSVGLQAPSACVSPPPLIFWASCKVSIWVN